MTTENALRVADLKLHNHSLTEVRDAKIKSERGSMLYLDPMKRGDVAMLSLNGSSLLFICGIPRAKLERGTGLLTFSEDIRSLPDSHWILDQIYSAFPNWRRRVEQSQSVLDNAIRIT